MGERTVYQLVKCRKEPWLTLRAVSGGKSVYLHSPYDPVREACKVAAAEKVGGDCRVILFGMGMGYLAREILHRIGPGGGAWQQSSGTPG